MQVRTAAGAAVAGAVNQPGGLQQPAAGECDQAGRHVIAFLRERFHQRIAVERGAVAVAQGLQFGGTAQVQKVQHAFVQVQRGRVQPNAAAQRQRSLTGVQSVAIRRRAIGQQRHFLARFWRHQHREAPPSAVAHLIGKLALRLGSPAIQIKPQGSYLRLHKGFARRTQHHHALR